MSDNIIRVRAGSYTVINNHALRNPQLSFKAMGLLTYLMSLPSDWKIYVEELTTHCTDGASSIGAGIKELIAAGYCKREAVRKDGRIASWNLRVCEIPFCDLLDEEILELENQHQENRALQSTKGTNEPKDLFKESQKSFFPNQNSETEFEESHIYPNLKSLLADMEAVGVDCQYYIDCVKDWAAALPLKDKRRKRTAKGWLATVRNFMRSDKEKGKLHMNVTGAAQKDAATLEYLKL